MPQLASLGAACSTQGVAMQAGLQADCHAYPLMHPRVLCGLCSAVLVLVVMKLASGLVTCCACTSAMLKAKAGRRP